MAQYCLYLYINIIQSVFYYTLKYVIYKSRFPSLTIKNEHEDGRLHPLAFVLLYSQYRN